MKSKPMGRYLLVDMGSTSLKWAVYHPEKMKKSQVCSLPFPQPINKTAPFFEVDPEEIFQQVIVSLNGFVSLDRIYFSTQMHGYLLGRKSGEMLTPYISWRDQRSTFVADPKSYTRLLPFKLPADSGTALKSNSPIVSLHAMSHLYPDIFSQAEEFYTLGSYIAYRLTGVNAAHITDTAASGLYNKNDGTPQYNIYPQLKTPQAFLTVKPVGYWQDSAIFCPVGDQQASVLGSMLNYDNEYILNIGTAAQLCVVARKAVYGDFESRPYFDRKVLCTVTGLPGGREIASGSGPQTIFNKLVKNYCQALEKLPPRQVLIVIGGALKYHGPLILKVCKELRLPFTLRPEPDALDGLIQLIIGKK